MNPIPVRGAVLALACAAAMVAPSTAQTTVSSPLSPRAAAPLDEVSGLPALDVDRAAVRALTTHSEVRLAGVPLLGTSVDLSLRRLDLSKMEFGFQVDGAPAPELLDGLDLSVWTGTVAGETDSEVLISFSTTGVQGWVTRAGDRVNLIPQPAAGNDWNSSITLLARDGDLAERGLEQNALCGLDELGPRGTPFEAIPSVDVVPPMPQFEGAASCATWECPIAIETDFQLYSIFNDLGAVTSYLTTLLAAISDRYVEQIDTQLVYPYVQFYTTSADPWSTPESGGSMLDMLDEFEIAWQGAVPGGAILGHFVSGANLGGGVAYLGVLCDDTQTFSFAVSGNLAGATPFPIVVGPLNWDFMVFAHETGHNFSSPHTHDYVPQIDNCANGDCITDGTIMSYCHLCPGGMSNITTFFNEPTVAGVMQAHAAACLPSIEPLAVDASAQPALIAPDVPTPFGATLQGTPVGTVDFNYRFGSVGGFTSVAMTDVGGGVFAATMPAASCGDDPEWFFSMTDADCGFFTTPTFSAEVGDATVVLLDEFEADSGWSVGGPDDFATTGIWERDDPIGTGAQPEDDFTSGGTDCWFTGQGSPGGSLGEQDVDGGKTTLTSPLIDLSSGDARISYRRWYSNNSGSNPNADVFVVEISNNGSSWTNVETVGPSGDEAGGGWFYHEFTVSDFVTPNAGVQVRFIAEDAGDGSVVEAAIDDFMVFRVDCGVTCQTDLGSGGPGTATLQVCGGPLSSGDGATLTLAGATPSGTAFILVGLTQGSASFKGGTLVPVPFDLVVSVPLDGTGGFSSPIAGGNGPFTVYVQAVYPDGGLPLGYGISNAVEMQFLP